MKVLKILFFSIFVFVTIDNVQAQKKNWELLAKSAKYDTTRLRLLTEAGRYFHFRNRDSSLFFLRKAELINHKCPISIQKISFLNFKCQYLIELREFEEVNVLLKEAYDLEKKLKAKVLMNETFLIQLSKNNANMNFYNVIKVGVKFEMSLNFNNKEDNNLAFKLYNQLFTSYLGIGNPAKAKYYIGKMLQYSKNAEDTLTAYSRLYFEHILEQKIDSTLLLKSLVLSRKTGLFEREVNLIINATDHLTYYGHPDLAISILQKMLQENKTKGSFWLPYFYVNMAEAYLIKKEYKKSMFYFKKVEPFLKYKEYWRFKQGVYNFESQLYEKLGDYKKAYFLRNLYWESRIITDANKQKQKVAEFDARFDLAQKKAQIARNEAINAIQQERINAKQVQNNWLIFILIFLLIFFMITVWNYKKMQVLSKRLSRKSNSLAESNRLKSKLFGILSHDLKEPLNELRTMLLLFHSKDISEAKMIELTKKLDQKIFSLQLMLENILSWSIEQLKGETKDLKRINLEKLIDRTIYNLSTQINKKEIVVKKNIKPLRIDVNEVQMEIVLRNLLTNAIKFSKPGGHININVDSWDNEVNIAISDNGIGIKPDKMQEIFNFPRSSPGTEGEIGTGLGLRICKELIEKNNGSLSLTNLEHGVMAKIVLHLN